jgi:hypothetical protein
MTSLSADCPRRRVPACTLFVTTGLDPVVDADVRLTMDCRIKSGNDELKRVDPAVATSNGRRRAGRT